MRLQNKQARVQIGRLKAKVAKNADLGSSLEGFPAGAGNVGVWKGGGVGGYVNV